MHTILRRLFTHLLLLIFSKVYFQNLGRGNTILRPIRPVSHSSAGPHELESEEQKDPDKNLIDPVDLLARSEPREESFQDHVACVLSQLKLPVGCFLLLS